MDSRSAGALIAALLVVATAPALAQDAAGADEPVRVYTNADLERLAPIPTQPAEPPSAEEVARRWEFVQSVLDQAYARIDAERRHDLERRMTEARADALDRVDARPRYALPYSYSYVAPYGVPYRGRDGRPATHPAASLLWERPNAKLFRPIPPIHARPYASNLFRLEARIGAGPAGPGRPGRP